MTTESKPDEPRAAELLGESGPIARRLEQYEVRPEQLAMARSVELAFANRQHLLVEAGTGVGKSFAYLLPAILKATSGQKGDKPVVISTGSIALQGQLIGKDLPFLRSVWDREFTAVLAKGRGNYLSRRRMELALQRVGQGELFDNNSGKQQLERLAEWVGESDDGSLSDLDFRPDSVVWDQIVSDSNNCFGKQCPTYESCFYQRARRRIYNAHVLVVNHYLLFTDLALKASGVNFLPDYDYLILDEAHEIEAVASESLGIRLTRASVEYFLRRLYHPRTGRGLFKTYPRLQQHEDLLLQVRDHCSELFDAVLETLSNQREQRMRLLEPNRFPTEPAEYMRQLYFRLADEERAAEGEEAVLEIGAAAKRALLLASNIENFIAQGLPNQVYWVERTGGIGGNNVEMRAAPIHVGELLRTHLFDKVGSVVMTSATLATASSSGRGAFHYVRERLGLGATEASEVLEQDRLLQDLDSDPARVEPAIVNAERAPCLELQLGSPFNYQEQAKLVLPDLPEPNSRDSDEAQREAMLKLIGESHGGSFVLFTSYGHMRATFDALRPQLQLRGFSLLKQGDGMPRERMLEAFKASGGSGERMVLFGTDSFWQGIDVPGEALTTVIIAKLPFAVPTDPLIAARMEDIERMGRNPFMEYSVPQAIIKLKQGFGRLIRRKTDSGTVAILDSRIRRKAYGKRFIDALPPAEVVL